MIAIIAGTNRAGSRTLGIARQIEEIHDRLGADPVLLDLAELPAELFRPDAYREKPPAFARFSDTILASDGIVVVTPEYNGGFPGVLKYFIDMLKFPESFEDRPVCFVGLSAGTWGALRPVEQLQQVFGYRNAYLYPKRVLLPGVAKRLDDDGRLADPPTIERLERQATGFLDFIRRLRAPSAVFATAPGAEPITNEDVRRALSDGP